MHRTSEKFESDLINDGAMFTEYMSELQQFETDRRSTEKKLGRPNRKNGGTASQRIEASSEASLEMKMLMGYLWPLAVHLRVKKVAATPPYHTYDFQGSSVKGVLLDESHGIPVGSIAIYANDMKNVKKACGV
jgi:hypothetical protein